jgi:D-sedoheptulose 7-phosphate isomerase
MTAVGRFTRMPSGTAHLDALMAPLSALYGETGRLQRWGRELGDVLGGGGRLLAVGNGGSSCQAQHLTSELVGRYKHDRAPYSAIALCTETAALTAIGNDYGIEHLFARQTRGHGREGDVLVALSTSGTSPNVLASVEAAREVGMTVWGLCGRPGSPLEAAADDALSVDSPHTATVQEVHQVAIHLLCAAFEEAVA